jgi:hypothetical protein
MKYAISIITFLLVFGCSPQKKLQRLIKKHPELIKLDTIIVRDTIIIEDFVVDTITKMEYHDSTVVIDNSKVYLKYFYDTITREIHHEVECLGQEIITEKIVPIEKVVIQELTWWQKYGSLVLIIRFLILFLLLVKKFGKILL